MSIDPRVPRELLNIVRVAVVASGGDPGARVLLEAIVTAHLRTRADAGALLTTGDAWSELGNDPAALAASIATAKAQLPHLFIDVAALGLDRLPQTRRYVALSEAIVRARRDRVDPSRVRAPARILAHLAAFDWRTSGAHSEPRQRRGSDAGSVHHL